MKDFSEESVQKWSTYTKQGFHMEEILKTECIDFVPFQYNCTGLIIVIPDNTPYFSPGMEVFFEVCPPCFRWIFSQFSISVSISDAFPFSCALSGCLIHALHLLRSTRNYHARIE